MTALTQDPLQHAFDRSQRYWASDGIPEIVMGGFWLLWGTLLLLPILFPNTTLLRNMSIIFVAAMVLPALLMKPLIHRWKERVTFPRTGYIELRQPSKSLRYGIVIIAFVIAFAIALLIRVEERTYREWLPLGMGLLLAAGLLYSSWKMRSLRLALFSAAVAGVGIVASILRLHQDLSFAVIILAAGVACVADGLLTLRSYLRAHPVPSGEAQ